MDSRLARFPIGPGFIGIDEVGRGAICGSLTVCGFLFKEKPADDLILELDDSKKLSARRRKALCERLQSCGRVTIVDVTASEIDENGLGPSLSRAITEAAAALRCGSKTTVLLDGKWAPPGLEPVHCIVGGDGSEPAIAAASIIAKVHRDRMMNALDALHPGYGFAAHVGYGTKAHFAAIDTHGPIEGLHRMSFLRKHRDRAHV